MNAVLVGTEDGAGGQPKTLQGNQLLGQNVSSLHRLKDVDNKGEISHSTQSEALFLSRALEMVQGLTEYRWRLLRLWRHIVP